MPRKPRRANITSNQVALCATGAGTVDLLARVVIQADDTISGTATIGGGSVTIEIGNQSYPISAGKFSIPLQ
jgi:hypothetical protein